MYFPYVTHKLSTSPSPCAYLCFSKYTHAFTCGTGVGCGAAASGHYQWNNPEQIAQLLLLMVMAGPFLTGYTQTINDWYDREIDAINEPYRPIPSGKISGPEVIAQIWVLLLGGIGVSYLLDQCAPPALSHRC
jgi:4-hydroxybenzoate polyprenyltransferase